MRGILDIIAQFFRWLSSRNELAATPEGQIAAKQEREADARAKIEGKVQNAHEAVREGREDDVNKVLKDMGVLAVVLSCALCWGCAATKVVYVERDDAVVRTVRDGKPGWFVPDATMARLMEQAIRGQEKKP